MKRGSLLFVVFAIFALVVNAQSDYASYLSKAMEKLEAGDCESAQKFYNVYKDLSGESKPSVQVLIDDCIRNNNENRTYKINDKIEKEGKIYKVAHVEDKGKHGFAVCDMGSGPITNDMVANRQLPTRSELKIILRNRHKIKLTSGKYWTMDKSGNDTFFYWDNGWSDWFTDSQRDSHGILLIYRF